MRRPNMTLVITVLSAYAFGSVMEKTGHPIAWWLPFAMLIAFWAGETVAGRKR